MEEWSKNQPDRQKDNCQTSRTRMARQQKKKHIKSSTYDGYEYFIKDILGKNNDASSDLGSAQILNVTNKQIQQYVDGWADFLPKSSIKKNKALLRQIFKYAKREGIISIDPTEDIIIPSDNNIVTKTKEHVFISTDDRRKLESEMNKTFCNGVPIYGNNAKMVIFLLHTGLRFGELTALKWKNVHLNDNKIFITENRTLTDKKRSQQPQYNRICNRF